MINKLSYYKKNFLAIIFTFLVTGCASSINRDKAQKITINKGCRSKLDQIETEKNQVKILQKIRDVYKCAYSKHILVEKEAVERALTKNTYPNINKSKILNLVYENDVLINKINPEEIDLVQAVFEVQIARCLSEGFNDRAEIIKNGRLKRLIRFKSFSAEN